VIKSYIGLYLHLYIVHLYQCTINNCVNECGPQSTISVKVTWLQANDVMLPVAKNVYLIGLSWRNGFVLADELFKHDISPCSAATLRECQTNQMPGRS